MDHNTRSTQWERPNRWASTPEYVRKAEEPAARRAEIKKNISDAAGVLNWNANGSSSPPWDTPGAAVRITKALNLLTGESNADPTDVITLGGEKEQKKQKGILQRKIRALATINIQKNKDQLETQLRDVLEMLTGAKPISGGKRKTRKRKRKYKKRKTRKGRKSKKHKTRKR